MTHFGSISLLKLILKLHDPSSSIYSKSGLNMKRENWREIHMLAHGKVAPKFSTCEVGSRILPCARSSRTLRSTWAKCGLDLSLIRSKKL